MILISIVGGINCAIFTISYLSARKQKRSEQLYKKAETKVSISNESTTLNDREGLIMEQKLQKLTMIKQKNMEKLGLSSDKV